MLGKGLLEGFQPLLPVGKLLFLLSEGLLLLLKEFLPPLKGFFSLLKRLLPLAEGLFLLLKDLLLTGKGLLLGVELLQLGLKRLLSLEQFGLLLPEGIGPVLKLLLKLGLLGLPLSPLVFQGLALRFQLGFAPIEVLLATVEPGFDLRPLLGLLFPSRVLFHLDTKVGFPRTEGLEVFLKLLDLGLKLVDLLPRLAE